MKKKLLLILIIVISLVIIKCFSFSCQRSVSTVYVVETGSNDTLITQVRFYQPYEIVFHGLDGHFNKIEDGNTYKIDVYVETKTTTSSLFFLPFYKQVSFNAEVSYKWNNPLAFSGQDLTFNESRDFDVRGKFNLKGNFSNALAKQKINEHIRTSIVSKMQSDIKNKLNP